MKSPYTNSVFYTNENEVELFKKLGLYYQCFDYIDLAPPPNWDYKFEFWTKYNSPKFSYYQNNISIYLSFRIYICDKIVPIIFSSDDEQQTKI